MNDPSLEDLTTAEDLHPDLVPHLAHDPSLGQILRHPLIYSVPHLDSLNRFANRRYAQQQAVLITALQEQQWRTYVFCHEQPHRLDALLRVAGEMTDEQYWSLLGAVWCPCENIRQQRRQWRTAWTAPRPGRQHAMHEAEQQVLARLPERVTVHRGYRHPPGQNGLSWTLLRTVAERFARRYDNGTPMVVSGTVLKPDILAYFDGEAEIVLLPERLADRHWVRLTKAAPC